LQDILSNKIEFLKGVGPKRAAVLNKEAGIITFDDLLNYFPFRYIDKSRIYKIAEINNDNTYYQLVGTISNMKSHGAARASRITAHFRDDSGSIELVWFKGLKWIKDKFEPGKEYLLFGKATVFNNKFNFVHPDIELLNPDDISQGESLQGVYPTTENMKNQGLGTKQLVRLIKTLLVQVKDLIPEALPAYLINQQKLMPRADAYYNIHLPDNSRSMQQAINRLKFEEHFLFQLQLLGTKKKREMTSPGFVFTSVGKYFNDFYAKQLPFELTEAQKRVIREIRHDLGRGRQMNRLLQGDVGSGKTIVALMCMLLALDNGFQAALMAPTEILANQHFASISKLLNGMPVEVALLTGSTKAAARRKIDAELKSGSLNIIIGTHALIEETVVFDKLGLVIIDEQHRFGVAQRARFWEKSEMPPHILVMTATPIPRTLAMTQYGDLDTSRIDELPPGRKSIVTKHLYQNQRLKAIGFLKQQIAEGRQVYIVYPLIKESQKLDLINLTEGLQALERDFPAPEYQICQVHGQMKAEDKEWEMQRFIKRQAHIMVATTVIEVGVDIPNASVMVIEHADRFGLAQLHQLRGRVGRGAEQSYCLLITDFNLTADGRKRMETMVRTNDGFEIAEVDLELRGPGETQGTRQSGQLEFKLGNLIKDEKLIKHCRSLAGKLLEDDPRLQKTEHWQLKKQLEKQFKSNFDWSLVG
jgi:ATP-dependent DNA helicase RecG